MRNKRLYDLIATCKNNKKSVCILCVAVFILLFLCCGDIISEKTDNVDTTVTEVCSLERELEKKLEDFLGTVDGVGNAEVCIMFDLLAETTYAVDVESGSDEHSTAYVIIENADGSEGGLPISVRAPQIRGVAVSCEGGASAKVRNEVTALLTASLGISANRVYVSAYTKK